jgi:hypothetical protein
MPLPAPVTITVWPDMSGMSWTEKAAMDGLSRWR